MLLTLKEGDLVVDDIASVMLREGMVREEYVVEGHRFQMRPVHRTWSTSLLLGVCDYYKDAAWNALQLVPVGAHRSIDVPDMMCPYTAESAGSWRWATEPWPYGFAEGAIAYADLDSLRGGTIVRATRWEADEWEMFTTFDQVDVEHGRALPVTLLTEFDHSLRVALSLRIGSGVERRSSTHDWEIWHSDGPS